MLCRGAHLAPSHGNLTAGPRLSFAAEPEAAIGAHIFDDDEECLALLGQRVLHLGRHLSVGLALQDAFALQCGEALRECLGADTDERVFQLAEALGASGEIADDELRPFSADDACRPGDWAYQRVVVLTGAGGSRGFVCQRASPCHVSSPPSQSWSVQVYTCFCRLLLGMPRRSA